ncbi:MAG TPA: hypothetical protein VGP14_12540 [Casimicrobiaceae bacterium]|nr:hypothetical protein [Casimicrobiaceae bacterium]
MSESTDTSIGSTAPGHYGAAGSSVFLSEATIATAWNVQGDAASSPLRAEVQRIAGVALPSAANTTSQGVGVVALWLGPQSWLLVAADAGPLGNFAAARDALNAAGGALFDVSASRVAYVVDGPRAVDVLAAGCPLDFDPRISAAAPCRQSLYGRVPALFYRQDETPACTVLVARSFARDTWGSLCTAAAPYGYTVRAASRFPDRSPPRFAQGG